MLSIADCAWRWVVKTPAALTWISCSSQWKRLSVQVLIAFVTQTRSARWNLFLSTRHSHGFIARLASSWNSMATMTSVWQRRIRLRQFAEERLMPAFVYLAWENAPAMLRWKKSLLV